VWEADADGLDCFSCGRPIAVGERFTRDGYETGGGVTAAPSGLVPFCSDCRSLPQINFTAAERDALPSLVPAPLRALIEDEYTGIKRKNALVCAGAATALAEESGGDWFSEQRLRDLCGLANRSRYEYLFALTRYGYLEWTGNPAGPDHAYRVVPALSDTQQQLADQTGTPARALVEAEMPCYQQPRALLVLAALAAAAPGTLSVPDVAQVCGLERKAALAALHSVEYATDALFVEVGKVPGVWRSDARYTLAAEPVAG
jgi:hypothetical protein